MALLLAGRSSEARADIFALEVLALETGSSVMSRMYVGAYQWL